MKFLTLSENSGINELEKFMKFTFRIISIITDRDFAR